MEIPAGTPLHPLEKDNLSKTDATRQPDAVKKTDVSTRQSIQTATKGSGIISNQTFPIMNRQAFVEMREILSQLGHQKSGLPDELGQAIDKLSAFFNSISDQMDPAAISEKLKLLLENSGSLFEKKIADLIMNLLKEGKDINSKLLAQQSEIKTLVDKDLKPKLLLLYKALLQQAQLEKQFSLTKLLPAFSRLLKHIEQLPPPKLTQTGQATYAMTTYIPLSEKQQPVQLKVYYPKRKKGQDSSFHLSMLLNMSALGDLRSDFLLRGKQLQISLFSKDEATRNLLAGPLENVQSVLEEDFEKVDIKSLVSIEKIDGFETEDVPYHHKDSLVDIKA